MMSGSESKALGIDEKCRVGMNTPKSSVFDSSARIACTSGKENFPSVRSSAKPLVSLY